MLVLLSDILANYPHFMKFMDSTSTLPQKQFWPNMLCPPLLFPDSVIIGLGPCDYLWPIDCEQR